MEQQDAPAVKYFARSLHDVIHSILIDNYDAKRFLVTLEAICQQSCAYKLKGSINACCTAEEITREIELMVHNKDVLLRKYGNLRCFELPSRARKSINLLRAIHHLHCGRTVDRELIKTPRPWRNDEYKKEIARQEAIVDNFKQGHYVYYIQWENDPAFVKIGYSSSPAGRLAGFLTGSPRNLQILRLEPVASAREETMRHLEFDEYRHAREWFRYEGALKKYVQSLSVDPAVQLWEQLPASSRHSIKVEYF